MVLTALWAEAGAAATPAPEGPGLSTTAAAACVTIETAAGGVGEEESSSLLLPLLAASELDIVAPCSSP